MVYDPARLRPVGKKMALQPGVDDWPQWLTLVFSAALSILSGTAISGYFVGATRKELEALRERSDQAIIDRDQLRTDLRVVVHDIRQELQKVSSASVKVEDARRIEAHLVRQDERLEAFRNQVVSMILSDRKNTD